MPRVVAGPCRQPTPPCSTAAAYPPTPVTAPLLASLVEAVGGWSRPPAGAAPNQWHSAGAAPAARTCYRRCFGGDSLHPRGALRGAAAGRGPCERRVLQELKSIVQSQRSLQDVTTHFVLLPSGRQGLCHALIACRRFLLKR